MLIDESIPFKKFGHPSLVSFLRTVPGIKTTEKRGECFVEALPSEESAHISKLISRQKTTSKKHAKINTRKPTTPFRQPIMTRNTHSARDNPYLQYFTSYKKAPLMPTKITIYPNNDKPRYIQPNYGMPPTSPSKRLKDRQANAILPTNQSSNKLKDDFQLNNKKVAAPVITQKPKTVNNNIEIVPKGKTPNLSDRLKVAPPNMPSVINLSPRSPPPLLQSQVLSPLSPGQVLADGKITQYQHSPINTPIQTPINTPIHTPIHAPIPPLMNSPINSMAPTGNVKKSTPKLTQQLTDPREELKKRAISLNLPEPVYQICPAAIKHSKEKSVFAQVKIGPYGYSSYPEEARSQDEAQKIAAKLALADLIEKYGSPYTLKETKNRTIIKDRILFIVDAHPNGLFMHQVPIYYKQQYREILPGDWEKIVEECPAILLEKGADNSIILRRYVSSPEQVRNVTPSKTEKIQLNPIGPAVPGQLELPENDAWIVTVTCVMSTIEIWVRIVEETYNEPFEAMTEEMAQYYSKIQQPVKQVEIGNYYVVLEDESWHRVRCIAYNPETGMATVSFIDHGDEDTFHYSRLQILDKQFCVLPAQALRLCLSGLEDFGECESVLTQTETLLFGRALYVEVINRDEKDENGPFVTVVFYDTHGPDDINVNLELTKQILQHVIVAPKLDVAGQVSKVFISHVEQNGEVFVQVQSESMKILVNLLNRLIRTGLNVEELKNCTVTTIDSNKTYFVSVNNNWYRGRIVENTYNQLKAFLIDFGKTVVTTRGNLLSLEGLSSVLAKYPAQALKVHLHNIDNSIFNEQMVAKLVELAPKGEPLLVKVVSSEKGVPVVELFKRIKPSNMLVSINNTLTLEKELARSHGDGNNNMKTRKRLERTNSKLAGNEDEDVRVLKPPKISGIGEYFDVHVTMAAHPGNFTVQPFDEKRSLETLMIQLQDVCRAYKGPIPTQESVKEGKLYAAKHTDDHWYRVCISSIIKENLVSVYFCDFGDVSVLPLDKLQPLKSQFLDLPYQAIKARLAGIQPINVDWSVKDSIRFQDLVVEKNFVSIIVESKPDGLSPADTILGLKLIDVNTDEDIYIDRLLVEEGRATFVD
ncbi:tudor domain-containing protein 7 tapas isoform X2 [Calliopsis andreniformis]